ncbi:MAG: glycosyltransferase [Bacteroides sp.]|nr:glycosyltransferase [Bacteroides sp.]
MTHPKVSVIIPVFKAEKYIEKCARTLFGQTLDDMEYIFVDDCSPDRSIEVLERVLEDYPQRKAQVKFLRHKENKGVSRSRQDGVDAATGEYLIHCDPDDWVEPDMYELMYTAAKDSDADIAYCDFMEEAPEKQLYHTQILPDNKLELMLEVCSGQLHCAMWNKLISRKYIENINRKFNPELSLWEDMAYIVPLLLTPGRFVRIEKALYHYTILSDSITRKKTPRTVNSQIKAVENITTFIDSLQQAEQYESMVQRLQLRSKDDYLRPGETYDPRLWRDTFPKIKMNFLNFPISYERKVLYMLCFLHIDIFVKAMVRLRD